jgi:hypothetical protein
MYIIISYIRVRAAEHTYNKILKTECPSIFTV